MSEEKIILRTLVRRHLADTITPVAAYLKLRDQFRHPVLLESNDFASAESTFSYIGLEPLASFEARNGTLRTTLPSGAEHRETLQNWNELPRRMKAFIDRFQVEEKQFAGAVNGFFGHTAFDGVQYFDTLRFDPAKRRFDLPDLHYCFYRFIIAFNHFQQELYLLENVPEGEQSELDR
ncbi:MAG: anthranilate synthase component I family protein, partial [Bacteroidetes bacterium]